MDTTLDLFLTTKKTVAIKSSNLYSKNSILFFYTYFQIEFKNIVLFASSV